MQTRRIAVITTTAAIALGGLAACSSSSSTQATTASSTPSVSASIPPVTGTPTEIAFAQSMIPHHAQAVEMADLALQPKHKASDQVRQLATQIKKAQGPEIEQMTQWLEQWGAPTAAPKQHMHGMSHDMGGMTMSGMMSPKQMRELRQSSGQKFDRLWLTMMIAHHQGAIEMAKQVLASTNNPDVEALANQIIETQKAEISIMQEMLASSSE